jgi:hypothetical protein
MEVIRHALEVLYKGEIVQIGSSTNVVIAFPLILDRALQATPSCAFHSYEESLIHFARAIYLLRLEDRTSHGVIGLSNCGFLDPHHLYHAPPAETFLVNGEMAAEISGSIPSSYGIDLIDVALTTSMRGKNLTIIFADPTYSDPEFHVEVWKTRTIVGENGFQAAQMVEQVPLTVHNRRLILEVENIGLSSFDGLGIIVTRTDPYEDVETTGAYSIQLLAE